MCTDTKYMKAFEISLEREKISLKLNRDKILYNHFQSGQKTNIIPLISLLRLKLKY